MVASPRISMTQLWTTFPILNLKGFLHRKLTFDMLLSIKKNMKKCIIP